MNILTMEEMYDIGDATNLTKQQISDLVKQCLDHFRAIDPEHCGLTRAYMDYDSGFIICVSVRSSTQSIYEMSTRIIEMHGKGVCTPDKDGNVTFWVNDFNHSIKS
jgi:hypothetical protein